MKWWYNSEEDSFMDIGDGAGYGARIGSLHSLFSCLPLMGLRVGRGRVCFRVMPITREKQLSCHVLTALDKLYVFRQTTLWLCMHAQLPISPSPNLPHALACADADTRTQSGSTMWWFINEEIASGNGKQRIDDLRVIEVDAREDEKCVHVRVCVCLGVFEGQIQANSWDGEKWDWTSREISIQGVHMFSCVQVGEMQSV